MGQSSRSSIDARVARRVEIAEGVISLELVALGGGSLPAWECGAHIDLHLKGRVRQYSLCGDSFSRDCYQIAVLLQPQGRGGSSAVHATLHEGDEIKIGSPRNHFKLVDAPGYCFIAGGIGITPIRSMIQCVAGQNKEWVLYYGGRNINSMAFSEELSSYVGQVHVLPEDEHGLLPLESILDELPQGHVIYCCGPENLLAAVESATKKRPGVELHVERFSSPVPKHLPDDLPFDVICVDSGKTVPVGSQETILNALLAAGVDASFDCCEGTCGTCEIEVIDGDVDHRDAILTGDQRAASRVIFPCVSRSRSTRLILDI